MKVIALLLALTWPQVVEKIEKKAFEDARAELLAMETTPRDEALVRYALAYVNRAIAFAQGTPEDRKRALLEEAVASLERAAQLEPRNADVRALLGSTYGTLIGSAPERGAELGPKSRKELQRAAELEPHNPRVHLLLGTSAYHRPPEFGGGPDRAEPYLRRAIALFANEPPAKPWPNWGRYEAHLYLGLALEKLQRRAEAREQFERALALQPDSRYVRDVLIPRTSKR